MKQKEIDALFEEIELALASSHGVVATDLPETKEAAALLKEGKAWKIDHVKDIEALRRLRALHGKEDG